MLLPTNMMAFLLGLAPTFPPDLLLFPVGVYQVLLALLAHPHRRHRRRPVVPLELILIQIVHLPAHWGLLVERRVARPQEDVLAYSHHLQKVE